MCSTFLMTEAQTLQCLKIHLIEYLSFALRAVWEQDFTHALIYPNGSLCTSQSYMPVLKYNIMQKHYLSK